MNKKSRPYEKHHVGTKADFLPGPCRMLQIGALEIGVYNIGDELYAIRNFCPHQSAPICKGEVSGTMLPSGPGEYVYGMEGQVLACPWHKWHFDIKTGRTVFGTDKRRLITYQVEVEGDDVYIRIPTASADATDDRTATPDLEEVRQ